jgi:tRNA threonylcarbamoyladenosine biosynthesis protein TsaE
MPLELELARPELAQRTAAAILGAFPGARVFTFEGPMGAGKTTLIKALCTTLGVEGGLGSPSFAIVHEYGTASGETLYHFDLYRVKDMQELEGIGFQEYVDSGRYAFIEWPELARPLLPPGTIGIRMTPQAHGRRLLRLAPLETPVHHP